MRHLLLISNGPFICLLLILENLLSLKSKQADVIATFLHATLGEDERVYVEMTLGFKRRGTNGKCKVLDFKKTLYVFHQSPHALLKNGHFGLPQAHFDSCFFIGKRQDFICYVDDPIFWERNKIIFLYCCPVVYQRS